MTRVCDSFAYGDGPVEACFWNETVDAAPYAALAEDVSADVAIVGGGYTGLSAALHLAKAGRDVVLLDEQQPGWGASGRNGGFCCLGGSHMEPAMLARRIGQAEAEAYFRAERDAILLVEQLLSSHAINADRHSNGETVLAHRKRDFHTLEKKAQEVSDLYGVSPDLLSKNDLRNQGMGGAFHGGLTIPVGFALNPKKYALGLARAAQEAGAHIHGRTPVSAISGQTGQYRLQTPRGAVKARQVIIAANGYGRETVPEWIGGRFMPAQSSVIVTRPLSFEEQQAQGWTSGQMAYDTRSLLHYFRLMPDGRFLFGMRGGLRTTRAADQDMRRLIRLDFNRMFPAWRGIDHTLLLVWLRVFRTRSNTVCRASAGPRRHVCRVCLSWKWRRNGKLLRRASRGTGSWASGFAAPKGHHNAAWPVSGRALSSIGPLACLPRLCYARSLGTGATVS